MSGSSLKDERRPPRTEGNGRTRITLCLLSFPDGKPETANIGRAIVFCLRKSPDQTAGFCL